MTIPLTRVVTEGITQVNTQVSKLIGMENEMKIIEDRILNFCLKPKGLLEIGGLLGYKQRKTIRKYVTPLVEAGRLAMTLPEKPHSKLQKYITIK